MQRVVGIKYSKEGKAYFFSPNGLELKVGDKVIVSTVNGNEFGIVDFTEREIKDELVKGEIKPVLRFATLQDETRRSELDEKAKEALKIIKKNVTKLGLKMKVTSACFTFDGSKIIIEFTADDRVDFRELLKVLASELKTRIELKQIGGRDEVKNKGAIGPCGQICCCKRYLNDFAHVSVKMAKNQGISLTPTKINGVCGRLLCCLSYENEFYEKTLAKMPKVGSEVKTNKGVGVCSYNDILRERVVVKFTQNDGSVSNEEFGLDEIQFNNHKGEKDGIQNNG
ncbi:MAG: stage 0 sporulation protein [Clostridia bacterium]|nr:stage 0 sporulation protein [Clostridia bacterium]